MAKSNKIAQKFHIIMCEDVRRELGNKMSLMGVYGGEVILKKLPGTMRSLVFVLMLENILTPFKKLAVSLKMPKDKLVELILDAPENIELNTNANLAVGFSPVIMQNSGDARVEFRFGDDKKPRIVYRFKISEARK